MQPSITLATDVGADRQTLVEILSTTSGQRSF
jgi:hypothetical protein